MRNGCTALALAILCVFLAGCDDNKDTPRPVLSGTLISGTLWDAPPLPGPNSRGGCPFTAKDNAHIDVYDSFVVVTSADGTKRVAPLEWCSNLVIK